MKKRKSSCFLALTLSACMGLCLTACSSSQTALQTQSSSESGQETDSLSSETDDTSSGSESASGSEADIPSGSGSPAAVSEPAQALAATSEEDRSQIEEALNLANNSDVTWSYDSGSDSWTMSIVSAVTNPEIPDEQGVSVNVPGAYVKGLDTDSDGTEDLTADSWTQAAGGSLVIDPQAQITSSNGQVYTAAAAPCILTTGAAGYGEMQNQTASSAYAADGYISIACGNRGKQSTATDADGNTYYTGDAPLCLVDQKNAIRFVKYNILLGNLPGSTDYFVTTGGSGGGAYAAMVAATGNHSDFYDYEIEAGAVGVYRNEDGSYSTSVTIDGSSYDISDGVWGCMAYSAITSLAQADMAMAFEYNLDTDYSFNTSFQKALASYLSEEYMAYINSQELSAQESKLGFDLNKDGDQDDTIALTIEYDEEKYADTNGYGGTYLDLYLAEFTDNLQWYVDNLSYASDWTWFDAEGNALSNEDVAAMTSAEKTQAFLEGRYAKGSSAQRQGGPGGMMGGGPGSRQGFGGQRPDGNPPEGAGPGSASESQADGESMAAGAGQAPDGESMAAGAGQAPDGESMAADETHDYSGSGDITGTPDAGTTQSASSTSNSANYSSYEEMLAAYESDIASIQAGDKYGKNIVTLYDPQSYIGADSTDDPTWTRILMGASEGDMSMFSSLNLQLAWLNAGTDADISWQWDGGHVPSEIFDDSLSLYVDTMYGKYVEGAVQIEKAAAQTQTENGTATQSSGTDISSWVSLDEDGHVSFTLADAASYRSSGASKAIPGFDVIDYGQETYEFGSSEQDSRHFDPYVLKVLEEQADTLSPLFSE